MTADPRLENDAMFSEWELLHGESRRSIPRARDLLAALGLGEALERMALVGVVGSKGKGTAAVYASAAIAAAGVRVGTITGPGVVHERDRVRIDGQVLGDVDYEAMLKRVIDARALLDTPDATSGYLSPSGLYLLGGLASMAALECTVAVVEAGIGGLADELSLLPLDVVVVTEIFNEHAAELGPTLVDIAENKIGVVSERTKAVVSLQQSTAVREVIERQCEKTKTDLLWIDDHAITATGINYPPGLNRRNAVAGVRAGVLMSELVEGAKPPRAALRAAVNSVTYPGRLSVHGVGDHQVIVDSAISRDGLVAALVFAQKHLGEPPAAVFLAVPANKDFAGCVQELAGLDGIRRVFVNMPDSHLPFPAEDDWPWEWIDIAELPARLEQQDSLVVGTATYTARVLRDLGVTADAIFTEPRDA